MPGEAVVGGVFALYQRRVGLRVVELVTYLDVAGLFALGRIDAYRRDLVVIEVEVFGAARRADVVIRGYDAEGDVRLVRAAEVLLRTPDDAAEVRRGIDIVELALDRRRQPRHAAVLAVFRHDADDVVFLVGDGIFHRDVAVLLSPGRRDGDGGRRGVVDVDSGRYCGFARVEVGGRYT